MTTIACNRKEMAADSCCISDQFASGAYKTKKLYRIGASIYGEAGNARGAGKLIQWLQQHYANPEMEPEFDKTERDFAVLELAPDGIYIYDGDCVRSPVLESHAAIGSGGLVALYCMHKGMSPADAVREACTVDDGSRPPIDVMGL